MSKKTPIRKPKNFQVQIPEPTIPNDQIQSTLNTVLIRLNSFSIRLNSVENNIKELATNQGSLTVIPDGTSELKNLQEECKGLIKQACDLIASQSQQKPLEN